MPPDADDEPVAASPETLFALLGQAGMKLEDGVDSFVLRAESLGSVRIPSGRIAVCDPLTWPGEGLIAAEVSGGSFPVEVIRRVAEGREPTIAFAVLRLAAGDATEWTHAHDYGVDTGTACFADPAALDSLSRKSAAYYEQAHLEGEEPLVDAMEGADAVRYEVDAGVEIVAFRSGLGDGVYGAWVGSDGSGAAVAVMTSFDTIAEHTRRAGD